MPLRVRTQGGPNPVNATLRTTVYDADGNAVTHTDGENKSATITYNGFNEPVVMTDPLGQTTEIEYDARGLVKARRRYDAGHQLVSESLFDLDAQGRAFREETVLGGLESGKPGAQTAVTAMVFDDADRVSVQIDPLGRAGVFKYDGLGRLTRSTDPIGNEELTDYNKLDPQSVTALNRLPNGSIQRCGPNLLMTCTAGSRN